VRRRKIIRRNAAKTQAGCGIAAIDRLRALPKPTNNIVVMTSGPCGEFRMRICSGEW
jgi:hypothetical protein